MALDDGQFRLEADKALRSLYQALSGAADEHDFEVDLGEALTVEFEEPPAKFVVSPNAPVRQIWVSALSTSYKLEWDAQRGDFILRDTGQTLKEVLSEAVSRQLGEQVAL
jgi:CyaY protein